MDLPIDALGTAKLRWLRADAMAGAIDEVANLGSPVGPPEIRSGAARKQALYFGAPGRPLFGFYHPPKEGSWRGAGVVLCCPIGTDYTRSDRTYRHVAERLAAAGFACLRFDLFGTGDSAGDQATPGLLRLWIDDIGLAADELRALSGAQTISLAGLRLGATLAAFYAAEHAGDIESLVLWSPCLSGAAFVREVTRLHSLYARIEPQMAGAAPAGGDGHEALGLFLSRPLLEELSHLDLLRVTRSPAKRTLVIDPGTPPGPGPLVERLRELGAAPDLQVHAGHKFLTSVSHRAVLPEEVIDAVVAWLAAGVATSAAAPPPSSVRSPGPVRERPLQLGGDHPLFGILTPANPARARPDRPPIVLTNAGCVNRSGPHRLYVSLARRWAELGFDVVRVDLPGIGDTPVAPDAQENLTYPPDGLRVLGQAIRALGRERVIVAGLCSGGDYAFQLAAREEGIAGAWLLNPRTFCVLDLARVESGAPPTNDVHDVPRMLRTMAGRGVDTLLLVSRNDPGVAYVDAHAADDMRGLADVPGFRRVDLVGTDHSFTPVAAQRRVSDLLTEHLTRRYP
jgi:alpha-beta hydrolase superfamily lysophospholipase